MPDAYENFSLSIVVPVFNNQESIKPLVVELEELLRELGKTQSTEILFIDDGSVDSSVKEIQEVISTSSLKIHLIKLAKNFGQVSALFAGYERASGLNIVTISADLQDPVDLIREFISFRNSGYELVVGHREERDDGVFRRFTSKLAYKLASIGNPAMPTGGFDYFLMSQRIKIILTEQFGQVRFIHGALMSLGLPLKLVGYRRRSRPYGKSGWTFQKKLRLLADIFIESSTIPLRLASGFGIIILTLGAVVFAYVVYGKITNQIPFNGFALIMGSLMIFHGSIIIFLGIIGEYLIVFFERMSPKKRFIVENEKNGE